MMQAELLQHMESGRHANERNAEAIIVFVRGLVPVLRDAQQIESAKELERLLFMYDSEKAVFNDWTKQHMEDFIMALLVGKKEPPR